MGDGQGDGHRDRTVLYYRIVNDVVEFGIQDVDGDGGQRNGGSGNVE